MPWLILGIAVVLGLVLIVRGLVGLNPRRAAKVLLGVIVIALVGITVYLVASRGIGAIIFMLAVLLPMILRWRAAKQFFQNLKGPSSGQATGIETQFLRMNLDHDSGILDGTILEGKFKGQEVRCGLLQKSGADGRHAHVNTHLVEELGKIRPD